jgi:hypothetical protein
MSPVTKNGWYASLCALLVPSLNETVRPEPTVVVANMAGFSSEGADMLVNEADVKFPTGCAGAAATSLLPPQAASSDEVARPPSGSIGAPTRSFRALRREGSSCSAMFL